MRALEGAVRAAYGRRATVISSTPSIYATSHPIHDVVVDTGDDRRVILMHKDLATLLPGAEAAKPSFIRDPMREPLVYRKLLSRIDVGAPRLVASGNGWLLLEKVEGVELYQVGDIRVWRTVAERLAVVHQALKSAADADDTERLLGLLRYDAVSIDGWMRRAAAALASSPSLRWFDALAARYGEVRDRILSLPQTIIHGELYASNVLVSDTMTPVRRVCPIDWEMAAVGPGLVDVAALVAGAWSEEERRGIAGGYLAAFPSLSKDDLDVCRLHLAVQWLGWSRGWSAPPENSHSWLTDAQELSERLGMA